jgi:hypothetical protein
LNMTHSDELAALRMRFDHHVLNYYNIEEMREKHGNQVKGLENKVRDLDDENGKLREQLDQLEGVLSEKSYLLQKLSARGDGSNRKDSARRFESARKSSKD